MKEDREGVRRLKGDGLFVQMDSNNRVLEVIGDGCKIILDKNDGRVRIMGDGCQVKVTHNIGDIIYTGDGGRILLGSKSSKDKVQYLGVGGKISFDSVSMENNTTVRKNSKKSSTILKNYYEMDKVKKRIRKEKIIENFDQPNDAKETKKVYIKNSNLRNEINEKNNCKIQTDEKEMKNVKSSTSVFVTTTTTTTTTTTNNKSGNLFEVNKWFVSPTSVVGNFVENVPTVTVCKKKSSRNPTKK